MLPKRIYVAATSQHVGKTTTTLGVLATLRARGLKVGYCKPVGQQFIDLGDLRADKDALLFADYLKVDLEPHLHSPVILGPGATTAYIDKPESFNYRTKILKAAKIIESRHDVVVYEGTGHPGVGSVVDLSNAEVADLLGAGVIMIVEAGVGSAIDRLSMSLALFEQKNIPIIGVVFNKARRDKMAKVHHYVSKVMAQRGIPVLGTMPYEDELGLPLMITIKNSLNGQVLYHEDQLDNKVRGILAGSLIDMNEHREFDNLLLVVSVNRLGDALKKIEHVTNLMQLERSPLSGIIITARGEMNQEQIEYVNQYKIPVVRSRMDTYESVIKISRIEVKINTRTPWKVAKAVELFKNHVNLPELRTE